MASSRNGPLLGLKVDGVNPGETASAARGNVRVRVDAAVRSIVPLIDIELVFNGRVHQATATDRQGADGSTSRATSQFPRSGWMLLRAM